MRPVRKFTWAEIEWIEFCAKRGKSASFCASAINRHHNVVLSKAKKLGLSFAPNPGGRPLVEPPPFDSIIKIKPLFRFRNNTEQDSVHDRNHF